MVRLKLSGEYFQDILHLYSDSVDLAFVPGCTRLAGNSENCHQCMREGPFRKGLGGEAGGARWDPYPCLIVTRHDASTPALQTIFMQVNATILPLPEVACIFCL